ncbi:IclR family transcriptional regulator [Leucobacter iarius]|uniref:IclR family transcriptional regulator n=2 Tax=Leucobacter iarius TaxID=333963 RepID=A0ABP4XJK6_9MICO
MSEAARAQRAREPAVRPAGPVRIRHNGRMVSPAETPAGTAGSQTLDRGLRALEALADAERPMSISELADALGVHRSNAYRILRTLEEHRFVLRDDAGLIRLGPRLAALGRGAASTLHSAALPELTELANTVGMTAFVTVLDGTEVITLVSVEPRRSHATVAQRPGTRHPATAGAPGHAIEASLSPAERVAVFGEVPLSEGAEQCQIDGYALSHDEVIRGLTSIAVPLRLEGEPPAALAVVHIGVPDDLAELGLEMRRAAARIVRAAG